MPISNLSVIIKTKEFVAFSIGKFIIFHFGYMKIDDLSKKYWFVIVWVKKLFYKEIWFPK